MKNIVVLIGLIAYVAALFLPWGPLGSKLETGFSEEGSPGLLGIIPAIICFIFSIRMTLRSHLITLVIGILMALLPLSLFFEIYELSGNDFLSIKFGVYLLFVGAILIIYGAFRARKQLSKEFPMNLD